MAILVLLPQCPSSGPAYGTKCSVDHCWVTTTMEVMREPSYHDMVMTFLCRNPANLFSQQAAP